ncbi:AraC family transcriptional regulator [Hyphomicrobium sp.]|uniref:AraC family transcriptional regulator n=1 Tax=Hyphomicrobium sp. TaxID=82 RepID=UPI0025B7BB2A|nr:AraC family transcriptional regulator [Hyphomicrobium sp.]MCC7250377.1 helix-turn-helix transcriptional regulator [Hyphomicrobium sp.]
MTVTGHSADKYVHSHMLSSSVGRRWGNMLAERWCHAAGELPSILPRDTEVAVLLRGQTLVERQGAGMWQRTHARPGTMWLCPAGIEEEYVNAHSGADECLHIFLPGQALTETLLNDLDLDPARVELRYEAVAQDALVVEIAQQVHRELTAETSAGRLLMEALGTVLSAYLVRTYSATDVRMRLPASRERPLDRRRLLRVMAYIDAHIDQAFGVSDLASVACMSPAHFAKSFKTATGQSPHAFVAGQRLARAQQLLAGGVLSLAEIAHTSGFSSQSNFTRAFHRAVGVTPGEFRAQANPRLLPERD